MTSLARAQSRLQSHLYILRPTIVTRTVPRRNMSSTASAITELHKYSACDVADALLKLEKSEGVPRAGFLIGIEPRVPGARKQKVVAPAFTILFHSKQSPELNTKIESNIAKGQQWSDLVDRDAVVVVKQPDGQRCAAVGGHHASRIAQLGAKALLVSGRIRDVADMAELGLPVWSRGTSIVGAGAESKPHAVQVAVEVDGVTISPGDIIFCDPEEGAVSIPSNLVQKVVEFLPKHAESEDNVKKMISEGHSVQDAFAKFR